MRHLTGDVARKADIEALKAKIEASNTRTETVRTEIESAKRELTQQIGDKQDAATKWTVGTGVAAAAAIVALLKLIP
ncbi:MAG: hypothetical protein OXP69_19495 [Spirochaetaceae bacterium]|nr:hypothetical protein [Spirochaetaceae bacterium]MDE0445156.1 hypothetical protein [Spirochaetaceae bacterium]